MPHEANGTLAYEAPWVTELLRDILLEDAFTPVWRYAEEYHPSEESARAAIGELSLQEQKVVYSLYRDEVPLHIAYGQLNMEATEVAAVLSQALAQLRKPCLLRIMLKGISACERESIILQTLPMEDVLFLGVETLTIPLFYCDAYAKAGVITIENLMYLLRPNCMDAKKSIVPAFIQAATKNRMSAINLWAPLRGYLLSEENDWWRRLYEQACKAYGGQYKGAACPAKGEVVSALARLMSSRRKILTGLYRDGASERMYADIAHMQEGEVADIHQRALCELGGLMIRVGK